MHSPTAPMSTFIAMYSGNSMGGNGGSSVASFSVIGTNYFISSTFKNRDGYSVETNPYFAVYTTATPNQGGFGGLMPVVIIVILCDIVMIVMVFVVRKKRIAKMAKLAMSPTEAKQVP